MSTARPSRPRTTRSTPPCVDTLHVRSAIQLRSIQKAEAKLSTSIAKHCQVARCLSLIACRQRGLERETRVGRAVIGGTRFHLIAGLVPSSLSRTLQGRLFVPYACLCYPLDSEQPMAASLVCVLILHSDDSPNWWHVCTAGLRRDTSDLAPD